MKHTLQHIRQSDIASARASALDVLRMVAHGEHAGLPRAAAWGYPEPYTRDLMLSTLGVLASGDHDLIATWRRVFVDLARNQSPRGQIPSYVDDPGNLGASDTTPLFLLALGAYRRTTGEGDFLVDAELRARTWMGYQGPMDGVFIGQQPTSDWRDEQWVYGIGLFVNMVTYGYRRLLGEAREADAMRRMTEHLLARPDEMAWPGLPTPDLPYFALWRYKGFGSGRFDLLGNSLAIITGYASQARARAILHWVRACTDAMRSDGVLAAAMAPNLFPLIQRSDPDWHPRYEAQNRPGTYHNGGVWPFVSALHVVAAVAAGLHGMAEALLDDLTALVRPARDPGLAFGFNEWIRPESGDPAGNDWQTWSAALYLYAAACVEQRRVLYLG